jgi:hypothetical protein
MYWLSVMYCAPSLEYQMPLVVMYWPPVVYRMPSLVCQMPLVVMIPYRMPSLVYQMPLVVIIICAILYIATTYIKSKTYAAADRDRCICDHLCLCGIYTGGFKLHPIVYDDVKDYIIEEHCSTFSLESYEFKYIGHMQKCNTTQYEDTHYIHVLLPLQAHVTLVPLKDCYKIAKEHGIAAGKNTTLAMMKLLFTEHACDRCTSFITVFEAVPSTSERKKFQRKKAQLTSEQKKIRQDKTRERVAAHRLIQQRSTPLEQNISHHSQQSMAHHLQQNKSQQKSSGNSTQNEESIMQVESAGDLALIFPPAPLDRTLSHKIITAACKKFDPTLFEEAGCAVCGQLTPLSSLTRLSAMKNFLHILDAPSATRQERHKKSDKIKEYPYAIDHSCKYICNLCLASVRNSKVPRMALANGLWLGPVPEVLSSLRFIEKKLVARISHSVCVVKVASGMRKMKAHAIAYQQPIPKVYDILPPPKAEIEEVIAIMFTGPCKPSHADFKHTPFLVRCNHVKKALEWLILNHADYEDVTFSLDNLNEYPEDMPPVSIEYKPMTHNKTPEGTSVHDMEVEDGTEDGDCPFTVHGLTGHQLEIMTTNAVKVKALQHLNSNGKFLAIGHSEQPESIWHNPQLYPQMFPWLFPYGLGGVGSVEGIPDKTHKKWLLMYHDKRLQIDHDFPFIAFSHEQIKTTSTQCFLLANKKVFQDIKQHILNIDNAVLMNLLEHMAKEDFVKPQNTEEEQCFQLMKDVDHVAGPVKGSNTSKKWMCNEIWSLIYHRGAPFWYITILPADIKHPLCIYFAGLNERFEAEILPYDECLRLVCSNPVAGARFFDFMVNTFISDILGVGSKHRGIYRNVPAYYGTVEQQGRLTLHLHMLIWLSGNLTAQEMRKRILDPNSDWKKSLVAWLESCHIGEFMTGTHQDVLNKVADLAKKDSYKDPTETLPKPPPPLCNSTHMLEEECIRCTEWNKWWDDFEITVDDLISKSNIHNCERGTNKDGSANKRYPSCMDNRYGKCKARFPRHIIKCTEIDPESGSLNIKKLEEWMNFITPALTIFCAAILMLLVCGQVLH